MAGAAAEWLEAGEEMAADGAGRKQCKHNNMQNKKQHVHSLPSRFGSTLRVRRVPLLWAVAASGVRRHRGGAGCGGRRQGLCQGRRGQPSAGGKGVQLVVSSQGHAAQYLHGCACTRIGRLEWSPRDRRPRQWC
eukprot:s11075_g2.t1